MAAVVSVAIILIVIWVHLRRKRSKSGQLEVSGQPQPPQTQISVIMDNDKMTGNTVFFQFYRLFFFTIMAAANCCYVNQKSEVKTFIESVV